MLKVCILFHSQSSQRKNRSILTSHCFDGLWLKKKKKKMEHKEQVAGHKGHDLRTHTNPLSLLKGATQTWVIRHEKKSEVRRTNDRCGLESGRKLVTVLRSLS